MRMSEREDTPRARPLVIAPALLAALILLSTDAAMAGPVVSAQRDILTPAQLSAITRRLAHVRMTRDVAYPATVAVRREPVRPAPLPRTIVCVVREALLDLPPPAN
jgi:hypothetical protein